MFFITNCGFLTQQRTIAQNSKKDSLEKRINTAAEDSNKVNTLVLYSNELIQYDIKKAEKFALDAIRLSRQIHFKKGEASAILLLSKISRSKGDRIKSLNKIAEALTIFEKFNDKSGQAKAYFELGYVYKETDNYKKAIESFTKAFTLYKETKDELNAALCQMVMGHVNADRASVLRDTSYLRKTLNLYGYALQYYIKTNNQERICVSYINMANTYLGYNKLTKSDNFLRKSIDYSNQSLEISQNLKDNTRTCINLLNLGEAYKYRNDYPEALNYFLKAYELAQKSGNVLNKLSAMNQMMLIYKEMGALNKVLSISNEYLKIAKYNHYIGNLKDHYQLLSEIYHSQNNYQKAYESRLLYESYSDSILNKEKANALARFQVEFESKNKDKEIALLNKNQELQQTKLEQQQTIRNYLVGAVTLILLLLFVVYNRFKLKVKANQIITEKNKKLEKLSIVARETANGVFITDKDGNAEWFNEGFSKLFGWQNMEEYLQKRGKNILEVSGKDNIKDIIEECIREKKSIRYDAINPIKGGDEIWVQTTLTPIFDKNGNLKNLVFVDADITELKKSEQQVSDMNKELEAFSYSVSHDLRAPLRAISGYSQILKDDYAYVMDEEGIRTLNAILKNSKKMGELIDDLLAFSRLRRADLTTSHLNMTQLVTSLLEEVIEKDHDNVSVKITDLLPAKGSQALITQVWTNLLSNALKFSKKKDKPVIEIGSYPENDSVVYYVKDNGAGFDMQYYHKLFGVFQRLHSQEEFEGTGIGLAIVQKIIHRHNGSVWAESKLGEGSSFYFSLPNITS